MGEACAYAQLQQILGFARLSRFEVAVRQENLSKYDSVTFGHNVPTINAVANLAKIPQNNCKYFEKLWVWLQYFYDILWFLHSTRQNDPKTALKIVSIWQITLYNVTPWMIHMERIIVCKIILIESWGMQLYICIPDVVSVPVRYRQSKDWLSRRNLAIFGFFTSSVFPYRSSHLVVIMSGVAATLSVSHIRESPSASLFFSFGRCWWAFFVCCFVSAHGRPLFLTTFVLMRQFMIVPYTVLLLDCLLAFSFLSPSVFLFRLLHVWLFRAKWVQLLFPLQS